MYTCGAVAVPWDDGESIAWMIWKILDEYTRRKRETVVAK
jgi:hypothetical protein